MYLKKPKITFVKFICNYAIYIKIITLIILYKYTHIYTHYILHFNTHCILIDSIFIRKTFLNIHTIIIFITGGKKPITSMITCKESTNKFQRLFSAYKVKLNPRV